MGKYGVCISQEQCTCCKSGIDAVDQWSLREEQHFKECQSKQMPLIIGQLNHSFQIGRTNSSLVASTSESSHRGRGRTLWRTSGSARATSAHPARTPLTDHSSTSSLKFADYIKKREKAYLILLRWQPRVALLGPLPLVLL